MALININNEYRFLNLQNAWHLAYYISGNRPHGSLAANILEFKNGSAFYVNAWSNWAIAELQPLNIQFDFIVRALGSSELQVTGNRPLDSLGNRLANSLNCQFVANTLSKTRVTPPMHTLRTLPERRAAINGSYIVNNATRDFNNRRVLIIDDVTTTNLTVGEILRALRVNWNNGRYYLFCLGKTSHDHDANNNIATNYFN